MITGNIQMYTVGTFGLYIPPNNSKTVSMLTAHKNSEHQQSNTQNPSLHNGYYIVKAEINCQHN